MYSLFGEVTDLIHSLDENHPVSMANGDLGFLEVIKKECPNIDVFGSNVYRGMSSGDLFERVDKELGRPFMYTEFGADAFNAKTGREDQAAQAQYLRSLWQEIYEQSYGKGRVGNAIGGMIFQWSDGWWKYQQDINLDKHDTTASWSNQAYLSDWVEGQNNMNEEWFGIAAKGKPNVDGVYTVYPRAAYYLLQDAFTLDPYASDTSIEKIRQHFGRLGPRSYDDAESRLMELGWARVSRLRVDFDTYTTGGRQLNNPLREETRFDHTESFYFGVEVKPFAGVRAEVVVNGLGNVALNPINEIFYENRGIPVGIVDESGEVRDLSGFNRFQVYEASFDWDSKYFLLESFFRGEGHYHWGYEGDFFGLYPEVHQQYDIDIYNANAPLGVVFSGKDKVDGLKVAYGPQLWWGANPTVMAKYYRIFGDFKFAVMHQEDIAQQASGIASSVIPQPKSRKSTLYLWLREQAGNVGARRDYVAFEFHRGRVPNRASSRRADVSGLGLLHPQQHREFRRYAWRQGQAHAERGAVLLVRAGRLSRARQRRRCGPDHDHYRLVAQGKRPRQPLGGVDGARVLRGQVRDGAQFLGAKAPRRPASVHPRSLRLGHRHVLSRGQRPKPARRPVLGSLEPGDVWLRAAAGLRPDAGDPALGLGQPGARGRYV